MPGPNRGFRGTQLFSYLIGGVAQYDTNGFPMLANWFAVTVPVGKTQIVMTMTNENKSLNPEVWILNGTDLETITYASGLNGSCTAAAKVSGNQLVYLVVNDLEWYRATYLMTFDGDNLSKVANPTAFCSDAPSKSVGLHTVDGAIIWWRKIQSVDRWQQYLVPLVNPPKIEFFSTQDGFLASDHQFMNVNPC